MKAGQSGTERSFGLSVGAVCGLFAAYGLWRGHARPAAVWAAVSLTLLVPALTKPSLLRIPSALWWRLAHALGWFNARLLLSAFFFLVLTSVGLAMRLCGWDPLRRRWGLKQSGWLPYSERVRDPNHYDRMY